MSRGKKYWTNKMYDKKSWRQYRWSDLDGLHWGLIAFSSSVIIILSMWLITAMISMADLKSDIKALKAYNENYRDVALSTNKISDENKHLKNRLAELEAVESRSADDIYNYITKHYKKTPPSVAKKISEIVMRKSSEYDVSFVAIMGVMEVESSFNPYAESTKDARGLMQVMFSIWGKKLEIPNKYALHDLEIGIDSGCRVLREYLNDTKGNYKKALYKYIGGPNPMYKKFRATPVQKEYAAKVFAAMGRFTLYRSVITGKDDEEIPEETPAKEEYVHKVSHRGETLGLIARWYTGRTSNWKVIAEANPHIDPHKLMMDSEIIIPNDILKNRTPLPEKFIKKILNNGVKKEEKEENKEESPEVSSVY